MINSVNNYPVSQLFDIETGVVYRRCLTCA